MSANAARPLSDLPYADFLPYVSLTPNEQLFKTSLAASYASRFRFNPHNLESSWYGFGYRFLDALTGSSKRLIVVPQERFVVEQELPDSNSENLDLSRSIGSIHTAPALSLIPDFTMIYVSSYFPGIDNLNNFAQEDPKFHLLKVSKTYSSVPIIMEVKPMPSRKLKEKDLLDKVMNKLDKACEQLMRQAALVFHSYPQQGRLLLIAMAGPFWKRVWVTPADVPRLEDAINQSDSDFEDWLEEDTNTKDGSGGDDFLSFPEASTGKENPQRFTLSLLQTYEVVDYTRYPNILAEPLRTAELIENVNTWMEKPGSSKWSLLYQWGSITSNQQTGAIHNYLESICDNPRQYLTQD